METTSDIQNLFDAIRQTRPSDIQMRSTMTREHGDGTYSYDPSWVYSESGTRLGVLDDVWIYRQGMIVLNALQLVALEEGIISDETTYPEGDDFWTAVEALRDRGANLPRYEPKGTTLNETESTRDNTESIDRWKVARILNHGERVRTYVHPYDRDYQEDLALELTPIIIDAIEELHLTSPVAYRTAELYIKAHTAGIVPGGAHERTIAAALRIATIEANSPRPLADIGHVLDENPKSIRRKFHRLLKETDLSEVLDASSLIIHPEQYVSYMAAKLGWNDDEELCARVSRLLTEAESDGTNPISEVAAAFYVAMQHSNRHSITQQEIAEAAGLSKVTIRNNYRKYT